MIYLGNLEMYFSLLSLRYIPVYNLHQQIIEQLNLVLARCGLQVIAADAAVIGLAYRFSVSRIVVRA